MDYEGMTRQVQSICGFKYSEADIIRDLRYTFSVEETTNRILDGSFLEGVPELGRSESNSTLVSPMIKEGDRAFDRAKASLLTIPIQVDSESSDEDFLPKSAQKSHLSQEIDDLSIAESFSSKRRRDTHSESIVLESDDEIPPFKTTPSFQRTAPPRYIFQSLSETPIQEKRNLPVTNTMEHERVSFSSDDEVEIWKPVKKNHVRQERATPPNAPLIDGRKASEKELEKHRLREAKRIQKESEKEQKAQERLEKKRQKEFEKEQEKLRKQQEKALKAVNQKNMRSTSTSELTLYLCSTWAKSPVFATLKEKLEPLVAAIKVQDMQMQSCFYWLRQVECEYDFEQSIWKPVPTRMEMEPFALLSLSADVFADMVHKNGVLNYFSNATLQFPGCTIIILIHDLDTYYKKRQSQITRSENARLRGLLDQNRRANISTPLLGPTRDEIEDQLLFLQLFGKNKCKIHLCDEGEVATWITSFTQQIAQAPRK
jgi:hypothetical protein